MICKNKIHRIVQYALLRAADSESYAERELGPIHLIKYLYLVDMDYAKYNDGRIFTGIEWKFHHFGPWSFPAFSELEPALLEIGANRKKLSSVYGENDYDRWSIRTNHIDDKSINDALPLEVRLSLQHYVRKFKNNTYYLLHFVYATPPMLNAAPGETLDFSHMVKHDSTIKAEPYTPFLERISATKRKRLHARMALLKAKVSENAKSSSIYRQPMELHADQVFENGMEWLDSLAGDSLPESALVEFSPEIWKSEARNGDG